MPNPPFLDFLLTEVLKDIPEIRSRAMFGGYSLYSDKTIFGMVVDDSLYFKVDGSNKDQYLQAGSQPFTYTHDKTGKQVAMSYYEVPAGIIDSPELISWANQSIAISQKSKT